MILDGLYIEDYKADVDDKEIFAFTYSNSSIAEPEAIKNNYSKSVTLKGTNNNNKIFGEIWNLDREIVDSQDYLIGASFNPKKRANFKLYDNGELLESGYICLDNITINKGVIAYSITLFGSLGDFFYNLMYNESGEEKSLADLYLGLENEPKDKKKDFMQWTAQYINNSWDKLRGEFVEQDKSPQNWITAAPTYSGLYDDFDNDKVLVAVDSLPNEVKNNLLPENFSKDGKNYHKQDGYGLCTLQRDFSEWETRDLRSLYQRPAFRTRLLLDAISNPENNGGYEVVLDKEIKESPYYTESFIVSPRLEWEDGYTNSTDINFNAEPYTDSAVIFNVLTKDGSREFDFSNLNNPAVSLVLREKITTNNTIPNEIYSSRLKINNDGFLQFGYHTNILGGFLYTVAIANSAGERDSISKFIVLYDEFDIKYNKDLFLSTLRHYAKVDKVTFECIGSADRKGNTAYYETKDFTINFNVPKTEEVTITVEKQYFVFTLKGVEGNEVVVTQTGETSIEFTQEQLNTLGQVIVDNNFNNKINRDKTSYKAKEWLSLTSSTSINGNSIYYDGVSSNVQYINLNKSVLFGNLGTPYKILTDFCKQFNLRFRIENDDRNGIVHIEQRKNYFINEVEDISRLIDYSKDINIIPTTAEYKFYKFGTENEDTYAYKLFKNRYADDYSSFTYNSNYNFNNDTKELFEDNIYNSGIDYRLNSPYFNTGKSREGVQYPQICLTPKYEWQLWNNNESNEVTKYGLQSFNNVLKIQDFPKMCLFDSDDKEVDMTVLCFFNGFKTYNNTMENNQMPYLLTDNLPIMNELNDENSCFIYGHYNSGDSALFGYIHKGDTDKGIIGYWITELPMFSPNYIKNNEVAQSFYFKKPDGYFTEDNYNNATLLYPAFWSSYIGDLYDDNAKKVELYCFLREKPQDALRKFYFFSNSIWALNDITDYNYMSEEPVKCTFIKVQNINNYLN